MNGIQHFHAYEICDHAGWPMLNCPGDLAEVGSYLDTAHRAGGSVLRTVHLHRCDLCHRLVSIASDADADRPVILNDYPTPGPAEASRPPAPGAIPELDPRD